MSVKEFAFCPYCGVKLTGNPQTCPNCHRKLPEDDKANGSRSSLNHLISNPYREGLQRYREEKKTGAENSSASFWKRLFKHW